MKVLWRKGVAVLAASAVCACVPFHAMAVTLDEAKDEAGRLEKEQREEERKIGNISRKIDRLLSEADETREAMALKEEAISEAEDELIQAKVNENAQYESMKKRIKYMYERGSTQFLEILFTSRDIGDFLNRAEYVSQMSSYDRDMLLEFQNAVKDAQEKEARLKEEYDELSGLQDRLIEQQEEAQELLRSAEARAESIQKKIKDNEKVIKNLEEKARQAEELKKQQQSSGQSKPSGVQGRPSGGQSKPSGVQSKPSGGTAVSGNKMFTHPCPGMRYKSSYFGEVRSFDSRPHKGNDYVAAWGTPTYAAASGRVIIAGWNYSAGNWVVIDHGNGFVTKYMHHSSICVSAGQKVVQGQQIGRVGSTGYSTGCHLHFQVEKNGVPVNPDRYL